MKPFAKSLPSGSDGRNYGIDLLRILTMFFICVLHICNQGGVVSAVSRSESPDSYGIVWLLEAITFGSVNIFGMISGYVGYNKSFRFSRPVGIWLELVFYTVISTILITVYCPELMPFEGWIKAFMPVYYGEYWYMTAYFGMVLLTPFLNAAASNMKVRTLGFTLAGLLIFFSIMPVLTETSVFGLGGGYSTLWLCVMYLTGAFLARINKPHPLLTFGAFIFFTLATWLFYLGGEAEFMSYTSVTVIIASAALVLTFAQFDIRTKIGKAVIAFAAPSMLAIFIIHVHTFFWDFILKGKAAPIAGKPPFLMGLEILGAASSVFFICFAVDLVRRFIFWALHIKPLLKKLDLAAENIYNGVRYDNHGDEQRIKKPDDPSAAETNPAKKTDDNDTPE